MQTIVCFDSNMKQIGFWNHETSFVTRLMIPLYRDKRELEYELARAKDYIKNYKLGFTVVAAKLNL